MLVFWLLALTMIAAAMVLLVPPLLRGPAARHDAPGPARDANVALYRERLAELDRERDRGEIEAERYAALRGDLERGLLADVDAAPAGHAAGGEAARRPPPRWMAVAIGLTVPVCGLGIYLWLGSPQGIDPRGQPPRAVADSATAGSAVAGSAAAGGAESAPDVEAMVDSLAAKLAAEPDNAEGWLLFARSRVVQERFGEAVTAFERAHALLGDSPALLTDWAEAEAGVAGNRFTASILERLDRALELDPDHEKALWLGGFAAVQNGHTDTAVARWERLLARQPPGSREESIVTELLAQIRGTGNTAPAVRSEAAGSTGSASGAGSGSGAESATGTSSKNGTGSENGAGSEDGTEPENGTGSEGGARIVVEVGLAPDLAVELDAGEPVFVFARAPSGGGPPVAVARTLVGALPATIALDESNAMIPSRSLASVERVMVGARVARSGTANRTSGDVEGVAGPVAVAGNAPIRVVISRIVP